MATRTSFILTTMHVIFWVIFIGLCIEAGAILISYLVSMAVNPGASQDLYRGSNLAGLRAYSIGHYSAIVFLHIILTALKANIAWWVIRIFLELKIERPFSEGVDRIISKISRIALGAGLLALVAHGYSAWLMKRDVAVPIEWSYAEILFFAGVIYIIAQVFAKGIELQAENELTI
jgi:hypothetical protein